MHWSYTHTTCAKISLRRGWKGKILFRIAHDLVTPFITQRNKLSTLPSNIKTAIVICGFVSDSEENTMQDPEDYEAISRKRGRCHVCSRSRNVKFVFKCYEHKVCNDHMNMIVTVTLAKMRMKQINLISCVGFPTVLLLQTILSYLHSWIQKLILNITGIRILYMVDDNHVIVICHCYIRSSFQWCQTVVLL